MRLELPGSQDLADLRVLPGSQDLAGHQALLESLVLVVLPEPGLQDLRVLLA